jgi:hypothetical protein
MYLITSHGVIATLYPNLYSGTSDTSRLRKENINGAKRDGVGNESEVIEIVR